MLNPARRRTRGFAVLTAALLLVACDTAHETLERPVSIEAGYRLMFNDLLVGHALFALHIAADGAYRVDAFTVPAGQMQNATGHEVLESSEGALTPDAVRPLRFDHSVVEDGRIELVRLLFDWEQYTLRLRGQQDDRDVGLVPGTHDRLSYLLVARRLAARGEGVEQIRIASAEASEDAVLEVRGRDAIEVPLGHYQAVAVTRSGSDAEDRRTLWFDTGFAPLPLRIVHEHGGNTVDMQLEGLNRRPNDPR